MATPIASSGNAPKAANAILHNASTPQSHLAAFSSPAPRSVPSPATQRTQAGKSPFNASANATSTGTMAALSHPTGGSSASGTKLMLGSSPAGMPFSFDSPNPMTLSLSNMGTLDSIGMGISMSGISGLGMGFSMSTRGNDQERTKRLEEVIARIKARPGRVSPEGIKLLGERTGMDTAMEEKNGTTLCMIAGGSVLVDVKFNSINQVNDVKVSFHEAGASQALRDGEESASKILLDNLSTPPGVSNMTLSLEKFAKNLDKLAQLDKLNGPTISPTFNCFEAISGVYHSLRKLYDHEKKVVMTLLDLADENDEVVEREVMCKKGGRPSMNTHRELGLKLDYWMQRRHVRSKHRHSKLSQDSEGDHDMNTGQRLDRTAIESQKVFSLTIECEASVPEMYPPARVSNAWISDQVEKPPNDLVHPFGPALDWLEPPATYLKTPPDSQSNAISLNGTMDKLPSIRFVARMNPPLLLPLQAAVNVLGSVGVTQSMEGVGMFDGLLLNRNDQDAPNGSRKEIRMEKTVLLAQKRGIDNYQKHANSWFPKAEYARYIHDIPFEHPKQLIELLPILRQYAFLTSLLGDSFLPSNLSTVAPVVAGPSLPVDVKLSASTKLSIIFPRPSPLPSSPLVPDIPRNSSSDLTLESLLTIGTSDAPSTLAITVDILPNADVAIVDQNIVLQKDLDLTLPIESESTEAGENSLGSHGQREEQINAVRKLRRALDVCGDIGIFVEWVRDKMGR